MTDSIPDEIMREAYDLARELYAQCVESDDDSDRMDLDVAVPMISRRLLARDQRAAEIALAHGENSLDGQYWAGVNQAAVSISNAILSYDEAQQ